MAFRKYCQMVPRIMEPQSGAGRTGFPSESVLTCMPRSMFVRRVSLSIGTKSLDRYTGDPYKFCRGAETFVRGTRFHRTNFISCKIRRSLPAAIVPPRQKTVTPMERISLRISYGRDQSHPCRASFTNSSAAHHANSVRTISQRSGRDPPIRPVLVYVIHGGVWMCKS